MESETSFEHSAAYLEEFRHQVSLLNDVIMSKPSAEAIRLFAILGGDDSCHGELVGILFQFLRFPNNLSSQQVNPVLSSADGTDKTLSMSLLARILNPLEPFGPELGLHAIRNWFLLVNTLVVISQGSQARLKLKYMMLPAVTVVILNMVQWFPEFLLRLRDYMDGWKKRLAYDSESLEILWSAFRGEASCVEKAISHANLQIASHFIALREETLKGYSADQQEGDEEGVDEGMIDQPNVLPTHMLLLMSEWKTVSDSGRGAGNADDPDVIDWYKTVIGKKLLGRIEQNREEINSKFSHMLAKFKILDSAELSRSKGQVLVLLKREFSERCQLLEREIKLISLLDSRHGLLVRQFEAFSKVRLLLDTAIDGRSSAMN